MAPIPNPLPSLARAWRWVKEVDRGVKLFAVFVVAFLLGALAAMAGWTVPAALLGMLAALCLLGMAATRPRRSRRPEVSIGKAGAPEGEDVSEAPEARRRPPAATRADRAVARVPPVPGAPKAFVPEPPPEDIGVEATPQGPVEDESGIEGGDDDIWA
jgi:predicted lipid-binding transport protein (Tim44 family)